ncbi:MAG: hypothetical protein GWN71_18805, partial [Gammaproteobacteria bacterium]|nr:hypothetical protein [Gemmatimonadota bacterium]NIU75548.1 hypothetical protein [Gammaproteobacteria bacterium]
MSDNFLPISAAEWGRFDRGRIGWDDPSAVLGLRVEPGGLRLLAEGGDGGFEVPWGRQLRPLAVLPWGPRLFVIEAG